MIDIWVFEAFDTTGFKERIDHKVFTSFILLKEYSAEMAYLKEDNVFYESDYTKFSIGAKR